MPTNQPVACEAPKEVILQNLTIAANVINDMKEILVNRGINVSDILDEICKARMEMSSKTQETNGYVEVDTNNIVKKRIAL